MRHSGRSIDLRKGLLGLMVAASLSNFAPGTASAAEARSEISMDGVTLRLVSASPSLDGEVRAALLIDLEPGWKTYWLDPGDAGIPPHLDLAASTNLLPTGASFPLPRRFSEAYGASNVYSQPLAVALTLRRPDAKAPSAIALGVSLGICREVCVPVSARLGLDLGASSPADARLVAYAFDALPEPSSAEAGILSARLGGDGRSVEVETLAPDERRASDADLFLAGPSGWFFGAPAAPRRDGRRLVFTLPIVARPKSAGTAPPHSVAGVLSLGARAFRTDDLKVEAAP